MSFDCCCGGGFFHFLLQLFSRGACPVTKKCNHKKKTPVHIFYDIHDSIISYFRVEQK